MNNNDDILDKIDIQSIKAPRKQSIVVNNFFTIITISIMSIVIIWYVNFILPQQNENKNKYNLKMQKINELKEKQKIRQKQIELSRRLNAKS